MFGKPADLDLASLSEQTLIQVCFGEHQTQMHFSGGVSIFADVEPLVTNQKNAGVEKNREALLRLVGGVVATADFVDDRTLTIVFASGDRLSLRDENASYESFQISMRGRLYVV